MKKVFPLRVLAVSTTMVMTGFAGSAAATASEQPHVVASCAGLTATIVGTEGNDVIRGTEGNDVIVGLGGNDVITGLGGADTICGGDGNDSIDGGAGNRHQR